MNDFTKDELQELLSRLQGTDGPLSMDDLPCLAMKIKYMIEDYCEHEWQECIHSLDIYLCTKCGKRNHWTALKNE